ncbi:hypothetical protein SNEBB_006946 [Seison nebaliae]|nr:hypothetical protein SNEBB_006946 [Seison nebaliae]
MYLPLALRSTNLLRVVRPYRNVIALVHTSQIKQAETAKELQYKFWLKNERLRRPMSPHIMIYRWPLTAVSSVGHRGTGAALATLVYWTGFACLICDPVNYFHYVPPILFLLTKAAYAYPLSYHISTGIRHLVWDTGRFIGRKSLTPINKNDDDIIKRMEKYLYHNKIKKSPSYLHKQEAVHWSNNYDWSGESKNDEVEVPYSFESFMEEGAKENKQSRREAEAKKEEKSNDLFHALLSNYQKQLLLNMKKRQNPIFTIDNEEEDDSPNELYDEENEFNEAIVTKMINQQAVEKEREKKKQYFDFKIDDDDSKKETLDEVDELSKWNDIIPNLTSDIIAKGCVHVLDILKFDNPRDQVYFSSPERARNWLTCINMILTKIAQRAALYSYEYEIDMTSAKEEKSRNYMMKIHDIATNTTKIAKLFNKSIDDTWPKDLQRAFNYEAKSNVITDMNIVQKSIKLSKTMEQRYAEGKVCYDYLPIEYRDSHVTTNDKKQLCLPLTPSISDLFRTCRNASLLLETWVKWRDVTNIQKEFMELVDMSNKITKLNGKKDLSEEWISELEDPELEKNLVDMLKDIRPLYQHLHAYVRRQLKIAYPNEKFNEDGTIPAHLVGNLWAQNFDDLYPIVVPYKEADTLNITEILIKNKFDVKKMVTTAEEFYTSIGLYKMTDEFWKYSVFLQPKNRTMQCHASAMDLHSEKDFRIKMCAKVGETDFQIIHHEMGHIEYYMAYAHQMYQFRRGANSAFHEAIGDTITLSVVHRKHLANLHLVDRAEMNEKEDINFLMGMALKKIAFLPYSYILDKYRWEIYRGQIERNRLNQRWWDMRLMYQGIRPPMDRSDSSLFDAGSKFHVTAGVPYIRYFLAHVLQFQFYERLCELSGHVGMLHKCDFYRSKKAGKKFKEMLEVGSSVPWQDTLHKFANTRKVDTKSILKYFEPLTAWLRDENMYLEEKIGW